MAKGDFGGKRNTNGLDKNPENINRKGPPKNIYKVLKPMGYSKRDVSTCFGELLFYDIDQLNDVLLDNSKPAIMHVVSKAIIKAMESGDMSKIKDIVEHTVGKPQQSVDMTSLGEKMQNPVTNVFSIEHRPDSIFKEDEDN